MSTMTDDRDSLIVRFRPLARHVAARLVARDRAVARLGLEEAEAVGLLTLVRAAELYDPARGVKPLTYFFRAMAHEVNKVARAGGVIRVPAYQTQPAHHAYKAGSARYAADVERAFTYRSLPAAWRGHGHGRRQHGPPEPAAPEGPDPVVAAEDTGRLRRALAKLLPRWRQVIRLRFGIGGKGGPLTLAEVGRRLGCTRENVRQTEAKALARLRKLLREA
jgi:RNA polymerase sigma factor (sigma-70 family)